MREFGQLEAAIMDVLWSAERPLAVREVRERLVYDRVVAYTTVMTVTDILHRKGALGRAKCGRAWRYWASETRGEHAARLMHEVLSASHDRSTTIRQFCERIDTEDRRILSDLLHSQPDRRKQPDRRRLERRKAAG